jgi:uncharacterized protein (TIGR02996 family)
MTTTEAEMLAAIEDAPRDRSLRLAYADWLEDKKDERSELVRIEEEMRTVAVFSDRYWQLKLRRNDLRPECSKHWLAKLGYGTSVPGVFAHGVPEPDQWKERWRQIRELVEQWWRFPVPDVSGRNEEVRQVERRLEVLLPQSVREWISFAHDVRRGEGQSEVLYDDSGIRDLERHRAISIMLHAEGDYHWAVRRQDLEQIDPPVYGYYADFIDPSLPGHNVPVAESVTAFMLDYVMGYSAYLPGGGSFGVEVDDHVRLAERLVSWAPVHAHRAKTDVYEAEGILVRLFEPFEGSTGRRLFVAVAEGTPRRDVPPFLFEYAQGAETLNGLFMR